MPQTPVYAKAPEPIVEEPVLEEEDKKLTSEDASTQAKRKGARALRTDLGFGGAQSLGSGLGVPDA